MGGTTIAAVATPPGYGGVGIVRLSGPLVQPIALKFLGHLPAPRLAELRNFYAGDGSLIDAGIVLFFPGPASFTGEDVLELHGHGGPVVLDRLLKRVIGLGAQMAKPGEFSERAFLNDKIDLIQAEAVADLIASSSVQAAKAAANSLQGVFSQHIHRLVDGLIELRTSVEAAIDFVDEDIDFLATGEVRKRLQCLQQQLTAVQTQADQGRRLRDGMTVVIAGRPNVGKSSLMNCLAAAETSIVTAIPGTTRDVLREQITLSGVPLTIADTAGLRVSDDPVESEGVRRAMREVDRADLILLVTDRIPDNESTDADLPHELPSQVPVITVVNKIDLLGITPDRTGSQVRLSAKTSHGIELLREHLLEVIGYSVVAGESRFTARQRHLEALDHAAEHLVVAQTHLESGATDLLAEELRLTQRALDEITGEFSSEALLSRIFASFCIGK